MDKRPTDREAQDVATEVIAEWRDLMKTQISHKVTTYFVEPILSYVGNLAISSLCQYAKNKIRKRKRAAHWDKFAQIKLDRDAEIRNSAVGF